MADSEGDRWLPGIEGLRGLAILLVLLFKFVPAYVPGGRLGVDLFFVISGFVISRRILADIAARRFSLSGFYQARARRLLPALLVMLAVTATVGALIMLPADLVSLAKDIAAVALGVGNIRFWLTVDYWRSQTAVAVLHGWSLGVEEQFYLLYPVLLIGAARWRWPLPAILGLALVASVLLYLICLDRAPSAAFFLLPPRMWELLVGTLLAIPPRRWRPTRLQHTLVAGTGLAAVVIGVVCAAPGDARDGYLVILVCLGAAALIAGASQPTDGPVGQLLALRPARFLGRISYSVYLWHMPILILYAYGALAMPDRSIRLVLVLLTIAVATASYRWIEMPIRRRQSLAGPSHFAAVAALSLSGVLLTMAALIATGGLPGRWPTGAARAYALSEVARSDGTDCSIPSGADRCRPGLPLDLLVWGDSQVNGLRHLAARLTKAGGVAIGFAGLGGCVPLPGLRIASNPHCTAVADGVVAWLNRHPVRVVLIDARWDLDAYRNRFATFEAGDGTTVQGIAAASLALRTLVDRLDAAGTRIIVLEPTPVFSFNVSRKLTYLAVADRPIEEAALSRADYEQQQAFFRAIVGDLADTGRIEILPTHDIYCNAVRCAGANLGTALFWDSSHMTAAGFELLAPRLVERIRQLRATAAIP